jgi:predicted DCC family thiol-disulfide oxidoreductase YuxK
MSPAPNLTVRAAPAKPLLVFDGDCHFCRRWVERWRELTAGAVDYAPYQEAAARFPEIPSEAFQSAVHFIEQNGTVYRAAEAVFHSLKTVRGGRWLLWGYEHVPGFAAVTETAYGLVARNRQAASFFTRLFWGNDVRQPTYFDSRRWFTRSVGVIYLIAFASLWLQVDGLIGQRGISPVGEYLQLAQEHLGPKAPFLLPTLCWINSSDAFLHFLCGAGAAVSVMLIAGLAPVLSLVLLFVLYLSLTVAGQTFLSFQWDILLLEAGFLAIFFAPLRWRMTAAREAPFSRAGFFLLKLLLFKLMLMSGVVKLTSGDDSWWNLTALDYHYWTQPLPTMIGWWAEQHPVWFKKFSVAFCLIVEIVIPFFIWAPRRLRHIAAGLLIFLQVAIAATGNYCFFNLLTIALCLLLIDDAFFKQIVRSARSHVVGGGTRGRIFWPSYAAIALVVVTLPINLMLIFSAFNPQKEWPRPIAALQSYIQPFHIVNGYGLFRVMTKSRPEIIVEGSADGIDWLPYEFRWKPGALDKAPRWAAPHQPRLDWQMWFAALGNYRRNPWFVSFLERLLRNQPEVTGLLARNPFPAEPPRYVRARLYEYRFTDSSEHRSTGASWKREERGEYLPHRFIGKLRAQISF